MASTTISRTISSSPTNPDKFTVSMWIKRTGQGAEQVLLGSYASANFRAKLQFKSNDKLEYYQVNDGSASAQIRTTRVFRDPNAWYHLVVQFDTSQSTASDRIKVYINGTQETSFDLSSYPAQNLDMRLNQASQTLHIGSDGNSGNYLNGLLSHVHFTDGQTYAPTIFGETDSTTGIWTIKTSPSVTYGDDGFFILKDGNNLSGSTVQDQSGQGNNFTVASGTLTSLKDCPDNVFNTLSPIDIPIAGTSTSGTLPTLSNANSSLTNTNQAFREVRSNFYVTKGKYYFEAKPTRIGGSGAFQVGVALRNYSSGSGERRAYQDNGNKYTSSSSSYGATFAANDIIGVALNLDDGEITFYKNGTSQGVAATDMITGMDNIGWTAVVNGYDADGHLNFGNGYFGTTAVTSAENPDDGIGIFEYDPPTGYRALCTKSINAQEYS